MLAKLYMISVTKNYTSEAAAAGHIWLLLNDTAHNISCLKYTYIVFQCGSCIHTRSK